MPTIGVEDDIVRDATLGRRFDGGSGAGEGADVDEPAAVVDDVLAVVDEPDPSFLAVRTAAAPPPIPAAMAATVKPERPPPPAPVALVVDDDPAGAVSKLVWLMEVAAVW